MGVLCHGTCISLNLQGSSFSDAIASLAPTPVSPSVTQSNFQIFTLLVSLDPHGVFLDYSKDIT